MRSMTNDENNECQKKRLDAVNDAKQVEFYSQGVAAWFNSALEHDKSLLTLSVAGIGVLLALMQTVLDSVTALLQGNRIKREKPRLRAP